jgi:hypothetical protein
MYSEVPYERKLNVIVDKVMVANYHCLLRINPEERSSLLTVLSLCTDMFLKITVQVEVNVVPLPNKAPHHDSVWRRTRTAPNTLLTSVSDRGERSASCLGCFTRGREPLVPIW